MLMPLIRAALSALLLLGSSSAHALPVDFDDNAVACGGPVVTQPVPAPPTAFADFAPPGCQTQKRGDGFQVVDTHLLAFMLGGGNPVVVQVNAARNFNNPVDQDLLIFIFGNTEIVVQGDAIDFFVVGTLDGVGVVGFGAHLVAGTHQVAWNESAKVPDVPAGPHVLDLHFGFSSPNQIGGAVSIASLYRVGAQALPLPQSALLVLGALLLVPAVRSTAGRRPPPSA